MKRGKEGRKDLRMDGTEDDLKRSGSIDVSEGKEDLVDGWTDGCKDDRKEDWMDG